MAEPILSETPNTTGGIDPAKSHFAKAVEEAKAGAQALGKEAQDRAELYRGKLNEKSDELINEAGRYGGQARERASELANEGKASASKAISGLGRMVEENAAMIDERMGVKYGDYARTAARSMQDAADKLDAKELGELGEDAMEFVRKSPGLAIGMAAVAGFMVARLFKGSGD